MSSKKTYYVLVIEDNHAHAELLTDILDRHFSPIIVHIVDNINAADDFLKNNKYHIILTTSDLNGQSVVNNIKKIKQKYDHIPVIVITGSGNEALAAKIIKSGINEYLVKTRETMEDLPRILGKYLK
ncbi:MAG: response regulator [Pseudomonadota bacterium]